MHIYPDKFDEKIQQLENAQQNSSLDAIGYSLSNSEGIAIIQINNSFESYDQLRSNVYGLYESTLTYLRKSKSNIDQCEEDNEMLASSEEEG